MPLERPKSPRMRKKDMYMHLYEAALGRTYLVDRLETGDAELENFLFSLGCYPGQPITLIHRRSRGCTVSIKDGRYSMDRALACAITVRED